MTIWFKAFATAIIFLTRIPMPAMRSLSPQDEGRALLCFPLVGMIIGALLVLVALVSTPLFQPVVTAALLISFWAAITGGLHWDGLADSADGWLGATNDIERTLNIMHDSRCGTGALVAVGCVLLLKFSAVLVIVQQQQWLALIIAPVIGRCMAPLLFVRGGFPYTPYVQATGIAKHFIDHCPTQARGIAWLLLAVATLMAGTWSAGITLLLSVLLMVFLLRRLMLKRLGGATGDTAGATTEIIETVVLLCCGAMFV